MWNRPARTTARSIATTLIVVTAIATTIGVWHIHPATDHGIAASAIHGASLTPVHECPACALAHAPTTPAGTISIAVAADEPGEGIGERTPRLEHERRVPGPSPRGPPLSV